MISVDRSGLLFCSCCLFAAVNGDPCDCKKHSRACGPRLQSTGQCIGDCPEHSPDVDQGLERLAHGGCQVVPDFDSDTGEGVEEFSWAPCDCCQTRLGGSRHRFATLHETPGPS